jgi:hypothetical protein
MKRALIAAAVGAIGALGTAGLMSAAPASAQTCGETTPPLTPNRIVCLIGEQTGTFFMSVSPANQIDTFLNGTDSTVCTATGSVPGPGTCKTVNDGLGILDQPQTFVDSLQTFANGPVSP